jgi:hypothetical protein
MPNAAVEGDCRADRTPHVRRHDQQRDAGRIDPGHVFLPAQEVTVRYGWGRAYGYQLLKITGFPRQIGGRYRLDTLIE